ncbi:MAG: signal peptidase II [Bacteroidetes bacterium]|nr:signal peptidase II [Bacteroidota bacterium]
MQKYRKTLLIFIGVILLVGCDLSTKRIAQDYLQGQPLKSLLNGSVKLVYAENSGGMLSMGSSLSNETKFVIFQLFIGIMLTVFLAYIIFNKKLTQLQTFAFLLFFSGGVGNLIDRVLNGGAVIDFLVLHAFGLHTGIFNVADVYIMTGAGLFILSNFLIKKRPEVIEF